MWNKITDMVKNWFKTDEEWYLDNSRDVNDLEIRMLTLQREGMKNLYWKYWYGH